MPLYHFSHQPDITLFTPRVAPASPMQDQALVWAIDNWHQAIYFVPRDCPRACFWPGSETTDADRERFSGGVEARMVIAIEPRWLERIRKAVLYRYTMPERGFTLADTTAGHWVSREPVRPLACERIDDLLAALAGARVELRVAPNLVELWRDVIASTMAFSGTRLRNAEGWSAIDWSAVPLGVYGEPGP